MVHTLTFNFIDLGAHYQAEMMRCLRDINVDHNTVGWYQSTYLGPFVTHKLIETQYNYQQTLNNQSVVIVHGEFCLQRLCQQMSSLIALTFFLFVSLIIQMYPGRLMVTSHYEHSD